MVILVLQASNTCLLRKRFVSYPDFSQFSFFFRSEQTTFKELLTPTKLIKHFGTHADQISKQLHKNTKRKCKYWGRKNFPQLININKSFGNVWQDKKTLSSLLDVWTYGGKSWNATVLNIALLSGCNCSGQWWTRILKLYLSILLYTICICSLLKSKQVNKVIECHAVV